MTAPVLLAAQKTLRDAFAEAALAIAWEAECRSPTYSRDGAPTYRGAAERAYRIADAMLEARKQEGRS